MTEEKNSKSEAKEEQPKNDRHLQYDMLIRCSKKGPEGIKEWNKWREENPDEKIWLQGADLRRAHLEEVILSNATVLSGLALGSC